MGESASVLCPPVRKAVRGRPGDDPEVGLMLRVQAGDEQAFGVLLERYRPRLLGYFMRKLGDRQEAEDLTQEVFLRLYRGRLRYRPRAKFATWLFHITGNVARNALRSRARRRVIPLGNLDAPEGPGGYPGLLADHREGPSQPVERAEVTGAVRAAVKALAGRQRVAVEMHQFQARSYAEVAAELAMTPDAAKSLLYRARNQLRISLGSLQPSFDECS